MRSPHSTARTARTVRRSLAAVAASTVALSLAACGSSPDEASSAGKDDPNATVLVWTDATRQGAFEAFQKANPKTKLKIEVVDSTALLSKIQLANRVGKGWPDVIFSPQPADIASLSSPLFNWAQKLDDKIPADVQKNFATQNAACTIDGHLFCLQNDLAQDVLWYNKPQMEKFGYAVPTTWNEYKALGEKVAKEHPGYLIGAAGGDHVYYDYFWGSGCPLATVVSSTEVKINTADKKCTRVSDLLDPLLANGSVSRLSMFDPEINKLAHANKLLMLPAASWFGEYVMKPDTGYNLPDGTVAAAPIPMWDGETVNYSGAQGGGIYAVSQHAKNMTGAVSVVQWVTTSPDYQTTAPTYPAYIPAAKLWLEKISKDPFYAADPSQVLTDAASKINPAASATRYSVANTITSTVVSAITSGGKIADALPALQTQLAGLAASAGYAVSQ